MSEQPPDPNQPPQQPHGSQPPYPGQSQQGQPYPQQPYGGPQPGQQPPQQYPPAYGGAPLPPLAHWGLRVGGYLIDGLLLLPGYIVASVGLSLTSDTGGPTAVGVVLAIVGYAVSIGVALWNQVFRQGRTGWSLGKQVLGIRLLAEQSMAPLGPGLTFVRALAHVLDSLACYIGWLWPLWDAKKQTFADKIMSTVVVVQKRPAG